MTSYRFLVEALLEYEDAVEYYERIEKGLGESFVDAVEHALAVVLEFPAIGTRVAGLVSVSPVRRRIVRRFDVEINYVIHAGEVVVVAVFHCKRRPGYWRNRLDRLR